MTDLAEWQNFYMIVGSSAGALIGLQFVVMTLIAQIPMDRSNAQAGQAFGTPNVVHFGIALLLSALICVPWHGIETIAILWGLLGLGGLVYIAVIIRRMRRQTAYHAVFEDWAFHALLPLIAYAAMAASAGIAYFHARPALFAVGAAALLLLFIGIRNLGAARLGKARQGAALLLLFIGIRNAWDTVTYHVFVRTAEGKEKRRNQ